MLVAVLKLLLQLEQEVKGFYLGDRLNVSGSSEDAVTAKTRIGWVKFKECSEIHGMFTKSRFLWFLM